MGKVNNHTPVVVGRKSDRLTVPEKQPNKAGSPVAEVVEESGLTKRNIQQGVGGRTQSRTSTSSNLPGIRQAAAKDSRLQFTALFHHLTLNLLKESFFQLKRNASAGVDGVTWRSYQHAKTDF